MATGSGKTFTAISAIYRLISLLARGACCSWWTAATSAGRPRRSSTSTSRPSTTTSSARSTSSSTSRAITSTDQRACASAPSSACSRCWRGRELPEEADEESTERVESLFDRAEPEPIDQPAFPIEDLRHHRHRRGAPQHLQTCGARCWSTDAYLIGLTATPNKQTFGFFNQNLVMEYGHPQAVRRRRERQLRRVYRIKTEVTGADGTVETGYWLQVLDKPTRARRDWQLDDDFAYAPEDWTAACGHPTRSAPSCAPARPLVTDLFPQRQELLKTLVFARTTTTPRRSSASCARRGAAATSLRRRSPTAATRGGSKPEELIKAFRTSYYPRIAVTVDMIATGTDIKPVDRRLHAQREEPQLSSR